MEILRVVVVVVVVVVIVVPRGLSSQIWSFLPPLSHIVKNSMQSMNRENAAWSP